MEVSDVLIFLPSLDNVSSSYEKLRGINSLLKMLLFEYLR